MSTGARHQRSREAASLATTAITELELSQHTLSVDELSLEVATGKLAGLSIPLDKERIVIGRKPWCDFSLNEESISNPHCEIWLTDKRVRIRDLGSRNGVYVNKCRVLDAYIKPGHTIKLGKCELTLRRNQQNKRQIEIAYSDDSGQLIGRSEEMRQLFSDIARFGQFDFNLLITGETGTGKSHTAEAIHRQGKRASQPFVEVNCGAISANLAESALFGHEKGAFTGADKRHIGFFEEASGGTLFLDEIGELDLELQKKLLDATQQKKIRRLGDNKDIEIDVRLIFATNRDVTQEIEEGRFREDLYYRIAVMELELPPLRERREDIPLLATHLIKQTFPDRTFQLTPAAIKQLQTHEWPGNVRQLNHVLQRSCVMAESDLIDAQHIFFHGQTRRNKATKRKTQSTNTPLTTEARLELFHHFQTQDCTFDEYMDLLKHTLLEQAFEASDRTPLQMVGALRKSKSWIYDQLKRYNIRS